MRWCAHVAVVAGLGLATVCGAQQERARIRELLNVMQPLTSPDGTFKVRAVDEERKPQRLPMLNFCRGVQQRLMAATGMRTGGGGVIFVVVGSEEEETLEGISLARGGEMVSYMIGVRNPETVDTALLGGVVTACLLNSWLMGEQERAGTAEEEKVPLWFAQGMAMFLEGLQREACFEAVEAMMMEGRLGTVAELLEDGGGDRVTAAVLVAWLLEAGGKYCYLRLQESLAKGAKWSGEELREALLGMTAAEAQVSWDLWVQQCRWRVYRPGMTSEGVWGRLRQQLYVYPVDSPMKALEGQRGRTFGELLEMTPTTGRRRAAEDRMLALRMSAVGRSKSYQEVVEGYCEFLTGVAEGERRERLRTRLQIAEAMYLAAYADVKGLNKEQGE